MLLLHSANQPSQSQIEVRVILEALRQSRWGGPIRISEVASRAKTSTSLTERILHSFIPQFDSSLIRLTPKARLDMAIEVARHGHLAETAKTLTWQEFEMFTGECLSFAGFLSERGLIVKDGGRRWQIDIVARRGEMLLSFDCKHWNTPSYPSKFNAVAKHQKLATLAFIRHAKANQGPSVEKTWALPIILTLLSPRTTLAVDVVLCSMEQLPDFLNGITPYSQGMPFICDEDLAENPIM